MSAGRDFINQVIAEIENSVLKPLEDIESSAEGILEGLSERMNIEKPRVIATVNQTNECVEYIDRGQECQAITGKYFPEESIILINYRMDMNTLLHLFAHHVHAVEVGKAKYARVRRLEELRLPWELRPTEVVAMYRTTQIVRMLQPRDWRVYNEEIKPRIKEIDEKLNSVRFTVNYIERQVEHILSGRRSI
ncbi:hypothetical protein [Vulcanisaeta sp. JCM 14467]|uniref:hypothetical protein n=1 Tax=Vulcanisaeta sp. JCM 14467 TaxID=1295370 RepID=UPI0006D13227|nr:hypothetical protein [Vulcanisaeta sp. JCM 14467]